MNKKIAWQLCGCLGVGTLFLSASVAHATISGKVFRDTNANGVNDTAEVGVPGITVNAYDSNVGPWWVRLFLLLTVPIPSTA